jgi:hypothetical protein
MRVVVLCGGVNQMGQEKWGRQLFYLSVVLKSTRVSEGCCSVVEALISSQQQQERHRKLPGKEAQ